MAKTENWLDDTEFIDGNIRKIVSGNLLAKNCVFRNTNFSNAKFNKVELVNCYFINCDMSSMRVHTTLKIRGCEFTECNLDELRAIDRTDVISTRFNKCKMSIWLDYAIFEHSHIIRCNMNYSVCNMAKWRDCTIKNTTSKNSIYCLNKFDGCIFHNCDWQGVELTSSEFISCKKRGFKLDNAITKNAKFM